MSVSVTVRPGDSYSSPGWMSSKYRRRSAMENQRIAQGRGVAGAPGGLTPAESRPRVRPAKGDAYERQPQREPPTLPQDDSHGAVAATLGANIVIPGRANAARKKL